MNKHIHQRNNFVRSPSPAPALAVVQDHKDVIEILSNSYKTL